MKKYISRQRTLYLALTGTVCNLCILPSYGMDTEGMMEHKKPIIPIKANLNDYTGLEGKLRQRALEREEHQKDISAKKTIEAAKKKAVKAETDTKNANIKVKDLEKKLADYEKKVDVEKKAATVKLEANKTAAEKPETEKKTSAAKPESGKKTTNNQAVDKKVEAANKVITAKVTADQKAAVVKPSDEKALATKIAPAKKGIDEKPAPQNATVVIKPDDEKPTPENAASPKETVKEKTSSEKKADSENNPSNAINLSEGRYYIANNSLAKLRSLTYIEGQGTTQTLMGSESENEKSVWHITPAQEQEYKGYYTIQRSLSFGGGYLSYTSNKGYTAEVYMDSRCNPGGDWYKCALWKFFPVESGFAVRNYRFSATGTGYLSCIQDASESEDSSIKLVNEDVSNSLNNPKFVWHFSRVEDNNSIQNPLNTLQATSLSETQNSQEQLGHLKPSVTTASALKTSDENKSTIPPLTAAPITTTSTTIVNSTTTAGQSITVEENIFTFDDSKFYKIKNKNGLFLNSYGGKVVSKGPKGPDTVTMQEDTQVNCLDDRLWRVIRTQDGYYKIQNKHGNVLNNWAYSLGKGMVTMQEDEENHDLDHRLWNIIKHNDFFLIKNKSGNLLSSLNQIIGFGSTSMETSNSEYNDNLLWSLIES